MDVVIKVDTGFAGAIHEQDTGLTVEEWRALDDLGRYEYLEGAIQDFIDVYAEDEEGNLVDI